MLTGLAVNWGHISTYYETIESSGVKTFEGGSTATGDILVVADGLRKSR